MKNFVIIACLAHFTIIVSAQQSSITLAKGTVVTIRTVSDNVGYPAALVQELDGHLWMTDRTTGRVLRIDPGTGQTATVLEISLTTSPLTTSPLDPNTRGGVYGLALHPAFSDGLPFVFVSRTTADDRLVIERYSFSGSQLVNPEIIFVANGVPHSLGLTMDALVDNTLLVSVASFDTQDPVRLDNVNGKIIRMTFNGDAVTSNPMYNPMLPRSSRSYIYSWGHRNPLGIVQLPITHASLPGAIFATECGPKSFDEINRIESGRNYGWLNTAGYCVIPTSGLVCPLATLNQAPSGVSFYGSTAIPEWTNALLVGTLRGGGMAIAELLPNGTVSNIDPDRPSDDVMKLNEGRLVDLSMDGQTTRVIESVVSADGRVYVALYVGGDVKKGRIIALENPAMHSPLSVDGDELTSSSGFRFGPNPVNDVLTVSLEKPSRSSWSATIVDLNGNTVASSMFSAATTQSTLSTSALASGVYMLVVRYGSQTKAATFIH